VETTAARTTYAYRPWDLPDSAVMPEPYWNYGLKSAKSLIEIDLVSDQPKLLRKPGTILRARDIYGLDSLPCSL
jgi:hypothetical protein